MTADLIAMQKLCDAYKKESFRQYCRSQRWWFSAERRMACALAQQVLDRAESDLRIRVRDKLREQAVR